MSHCPIGQQDQLHCRIGQHGFIYGTANTVHYREGVLPGESVVEEAVAGRPAQRAAGSVGAV